MATLKLQMYSALLVSIIGIAATASDDFKNDLAVEVNSLDLKINGRQQELIKPNPQDIKTRVVYLDYSSEKIEKLRFKGLLNDVVFEESKDKKIHVAIPVISDLSSSYKASLLIDEIDTAKMSDEITFFSTMNTAAYNCVKDKNGEFISGSCYGQIVVSLPAKRQLAVYQNYRLLKRTSKVPTAEYIAQLQNNFGTDKMSVVSKIAASCRKEKMRLTGDEMITILDAVSFENDQKETFRKLIMFVPHGERPKVLAVIREKFLSSDLEELEKLIRS